MRRTTKSIAFLAAGAVVSVATAVGLSTRDVDRERAYVPTDPDLRWHRACVESAPLPYEWEIDDSYRVGRAFGVTEITQRCHERTERGITCRAFQVAFVQHGWPLRCLEYEGIYFKPGPNPAPHETGLGEVRGGIALHEIGHGLPTRHVIPVRPLWTGLTVNAAFYALLLAVPLAPGAARRRLRAWRSRCVACGYRLVDDRGCPECGRGRAD